MPWDAGASMDRLQRTLQSLREMKQRRREQGWNIVSDLLGKGLGAGMEYWKTTTAPKRAAEEAELLAPIQEKWAVTAQQPGGSESVRRQSETEESLELLAKQHEYDKEMVWEKYNVDSAARTEEQQAEAARAYRDFLYAVRLAEKSQDFERSMEIARRDFDEKIAKMTQAWQSGEKAADRSFAAGESAAERESREGIAQADRLSSEKMDADRLALQRELPGIQTQADFDRWLAKYKQLLGSGMSPMEAEYGYAPVGYGGNVDAKTVEQYREAMNEGLQRGIATIGTQGFITVGEDGRTVENWTTLQQSDKDRVLDMVKASLRAAGLSEDSPMWENFIRLAELHMSYNQYRDNNSNAAPITNISFTGGDRPIGTGSGRENDWEGVGTNVIADAAQKARDVALSTNPGGMLAKGAEIAKTTFDGIVNAAKYLFTLGTAGAFGDFRPTSPRDISAAQASLNQLREMATDVERAEIESAQRALSVGGGSVDMEKVRSLIKRLESIYGNRVIKG